MTTQIGVLTSDRLNLASFFSMFGVALFAVNRTSIPGLEWYCGFFTAVSTHDGIHLSWLVVATKTLFPSSGSAFWTSARFILQSVRLIELLLTNGKGELLSTVAAYQSLLF